MKSNHFSVVFLFILALTHVSSGVRMMTGGWSPVTDLKSDDIQKLAEFATISISKGSNYLYMMRPMEVMSAEKQVVSGMNYKITLKMGATQCKKNGQLSKVNLSQCEFLSCGESHICDATIWVQSWRNSTKVTKYTCKPEPKPEGC